MDDEKGYRWENAYEKTWYVLVASLLFIQITLKMQNWVCKHSIQINVKSKLNGEPRTLWICYGCRETLEDSEDTNFESTVAKIVHAAKRRRLLERKTNVRLGMVIGIWKNSTVTYSSCFIIHS